MTTAPETKAADTPARMPANNPKRCESSTTDAVASQARIKEIMALLGSRAVLLPVAIGKKSPIRNAWQNTTLDESLEPQYQKQLIAGNVSVLLGRPSNGICSIDIDDDEAVEPFLDLNPRLRESLRTKGARGCNIWVQIKGSHPKGYSIKTKEESKFGEWRADLMHTVIAGRHPDGHDYSFVVKSKPVAIHFDEIIWNDELVLPWVISLEDEYGQPVIFDMKNRIKDINQQYWAAFYARENRIIYDPTIQEFYQYDNYSGAFEPITIAAIKTEIGARMLEVSRSIVDLETLVEHRTDSKLSAVVNVLKGIVEHRNAFDDRPSAIHLANCMILIRNGLIEKERFSPSYRSRNQSPIIYNPKAKCPRFLNELILPAVHEEDVLILQKMMGQALLGKNPTQRFLILDGEGGRGKTQFINTVNLLVGKRNTYQLRTKHLAERFEISRFVGKTMLFGSDVKAGFMQTDGAEVIKSLVGGDHLSGEGKNSNNAEIYLRGDFNVLISSNARLKMKLEGDVSAWRRRLLIVRYSAPPPKKKIPYFAEMLIDEEGSGILNWAIEGLIDLNEDIEKYGDIFMTERHLQTVDSLLSESDSLRFFVRDGISKAPGNDLARSEIFEKYAAYCPDNGWTALSLSEQEKQLSPLMLEYFQTAQSNSIQRNCKSTRGFRNVAFTDELND
jgi:P4 family phage/plasmid primase-like protien